MKRWWNHNRRGVEASNPGPRRGGFSLLELLVVISIIGLLASMGLPALKGIGQSNAMGTASRQLLDDLAYARMKAINGRTTVYLVFLPTNYFQIANQMVKLNLNPSLKAQLTNALNYQFTGYAILTPRSVGDQPGRPMPRYLTEWRRLPDGVFIPKSKFALLSPTIWQNWDNIIQHDLNYLTNRPFAYQSATNLPIPSVLAKGGSFTVPYVAFNSFGQVLRDGFNTRFPDEFIPLAKGSVFYAKDAAGLPRFELADARETVPGAVNSYYIHINGMSGRSRIIKPDFK